MMDIMNVILIPLIVGLLTDALVFLVGVNSIKKYLSDIELKRQIGDLKLFWGSNRSKKFYILYGIENPIDESELEPRIGYAEAYGLSEITKVIETIYGKDAAVVLVPYRPNDKFDPALFNDNVIIFGGEGSLRNFGVLCRSLEVPYYQYQLDLMQREFQRLRNGKIVEHFSSVVENGQLVSDIGTIVRIQNPLTGNLIILYNGNYGAGFLGAILVTTHKDNFSKTNFDKKAIAQELVCEVPYISQLISQSQHVMVVRDWFEFDVTLDKINSAIRSMSQ